MCLLICIRGVDGSLAVAANRDERYDRPTSQPFVWSAQPPVLAGRDELAGGTWLAASAHGVIAAVTNRRTADGNDPARPSRGMLPLLACHAESAAGARDVLADHLRTTRYNGFNLFVADGDDAFVVESPGARPSFAPVGPGVHVVANSGWNDPSDPRVGRARMLLDELWVAADSPPGPEQLAALMAVCRDHDGPPGAWTLCMHGDVAGTVSSTVVVLAPDRRLRRYLHAPGRPCECDYSDLTAELESLQP